MIGKAAFVVALVGAVLFRATPAVALESAPVRSSRVVASIITDTDLVQAGKALHVALRLKIAPGWHTYWSNPGDAGAPPELNVTLSGGATAGPIVWPTPTRLPEGPVMAYGYTGEVVLPVEVTPGPGGLDLKADATWLVCEKICVPEQGSFSLTLPPGIATESVQAPLFAAAAEAAPRVSPFEARVAPDGTLTLAGAGLSERSVRDAWFFPDEPDRIDAVALQTVEIEAGIVRIGLVPGRSFQPSTPLRGVVVLVDPTGRQSSLQMEAKPGGVSAPGAGASLWKSVALAVLGGLLLNLMPCVFPVLAMKAMALARMSGEANGAIRAGVAAYTAGVLVAFAGLGGVLLMARGAGAAAGWGFQYQSPVFVALMAWVLLAVGLNLSGVFDVGDRLAGAGQGLATRPGHSGSFFTGLLAVLVATPCTAPFMGAAIAAALAAPAVVTMAIFLAMGLGLALPYVLLSLVPGLHRLLPRPGPWMDTLKGALAFPMYAAAAWLLWVISLQTGPAGVLATAAGAVLVGLAAWATGMAQRTVIQPKKRRGPRLASIVSVVSLVGAMLLLQHLETTPATVTTADAEVFTPARLSALRDAGRPVFVNMTAAWCLTCLVNERVTLSSPAVQQAFDAHHVAYLKGDWTRSDPAITAYLQGFAREGVPLYVYYPAARAAPTVLSQILTQSEILSHLERGGG